MEQVVIYGGAFNPPTKAHQAIVQAGAEYASEMNGSFWLLFSGVRRDKGIGVDRDTRISYGEALLASVDAECELLVQTHELDRGFSQTIDTVRQLEEAYPDTQFTWIFGSDSIQTMPKWHGGNWLLRNLQMLVVQRAGYELELQDNMTALEADAITCSSTGVRERLAEGQRIDDLVPKQVLQLFES